MKRLIFALTLFAFAFPLPAVTLTVEKVQQRYPWNGKVDIDYTVTMETGDKPLGVDDVIEFTVVDLDAKPEATYHPIVFEKGSPPMTGGRHRVTWMANADGLVFLSMNVRVGAAIRHYAPKWMVIDVSGGKSASVWPVEYLDGEPPNGFNAVEYKGDKIVLRYIHPGCFLAGSPTTEANRSANEVQHPVAFVNGFYAGIFEMTQKQYYNITGSDPSGYKGDYRPMERCSHSSIRGNTTWPNTGGTVTSTSPIGLLRAKAKAKDANGEYTVAVSGFDLPTEFQWEYACRAGTATPYNNGVACANAGEQAVQLNLVGRNSNNKTDGKGGYSGNHTVVGSYLPNAWGLYDMHGNVCEWVLDSYRGDVENLKQYVEPVGPASTGWAIWRGGGVDWSSGACRSAWRSAPAASSNGNNACTGFRLFCAE